MNNFKKIAALFLALVMICLTFASCGKKTETGTPVALVDGQIIYSNDQEILDYLSYYIWLNEIELPTSDEISYAYAMAVTYCTDSVIWYRIYEKELATKGITFSEKKLKDRMENAKKLFSDYEGGFEGFRKVMGLSKNFLYNMAKYEAISEEIIAMLSKTFEVSDEAALEYFNSHIEEYTNAPGIVYDAILLEILDLQDNAEVASKKAEAEECIARLKNGADFDAVREEILKKYSSDEYFYTSFASGQATLPEGEYVKIEDLAAEIKLIEDLYKNEDGPIYDPSTDKSSDEYKNYEFYINSLYRAELMYALTTATSSGEIYDAPILSTIGYVVVKNLRYNESVSFVNFSEVKDEIKETLWSEEFEKVAENYREELIKKYNVQFNKTNVDWETHESDPAAETTADSSATASN